MSTYCTFGLSLTHVSSAIATSLTLIFLSSSFITEGSQVCFTIKMQQHAMMQNVSFPLGLAAPGYLHQHEQYIVNQTSVSE